MSQRQRNRSLRAVMMVMMTVAATCLGSFCGCTREASPPYPVSVPVAALYQSRQIIIDQAGMRPQDFDVNCPVRISPLGIENAEDGVYVHVLVAGTIDADTLSRFCATLGRYASTDPPETIVEITKADGKDFKLKEMRLPMVHPLVIPSYRSPPSEAVPATPKGVNARVQVLMFRSKGLEPGQATMRLIFSDQQKWDAILPCAFCVDREPKAAPVLPMSTAIDSAGLEGDGHQ